MLNRQMIQLTDRQLAAVTAEAKRLDVSASDVIRRLLDAWIDGKRGIK